MNEIFSIYVISLERGDRWPLQEAMLKRLNIRAERWNAVDGRETPLAELEQKYIEAGVLVKDSDLMRYKAKDGYKQSAIGLLASTYNLWHHALQADHEWTLILEDDCELHPCLADAEYVKAMWQRLPSDAEFVYLGSQLTASMIAKAKPMVGDAEPITAYCEDVNPFWVRMTKPIFGGHAYAVHRRALPKLIATFPKTSPIDNFWPDWFPIYAAKGPADWWHQASHNQDSWHQYWGVAAPRGNKISKSLTTQ